MKQIVIPQDKAILIARTIIEKRWGVKNPPPWLMCCVLNVPYTLTLIPESNSDNESR